MKIITLLSSTSITLISEGNRSYRCVSDYNDNDDNDYVMIIIMIVLLMIVIMVIKIAIMI